MLHSAHHSRLFFLLTWHSGFTEQVQTTDESGQPIAYQLVGTGDFAACANSITPILNLTGPCPAPPCLFNGVHQPPTRGTFHVRRKP